jgi:hypothetical protein
MSIKAINTKTIFRTQPTKFMAFAIIFKAIRFSTFAAFILIILNLIYFSFAIFIWLNLINLIILTALTETALALLTSFKTNTIFLKTLVVITKAF